MSAPDDRPGKPGKPDKRGARTPRKAVNRRKREPRPGPESKLTTMRLLAAYFDGPRSERRHAARALRRRGWILSL